MTKQIEETPDRVRRMVEREPVMQSIELVPIRRDIETTTPVGSEFRPARRTFFSRNILFLVLFVLPAVVSVIYFGWLAPDVYVSEAKFIVRSPTGSSDGLGALMAGQGMTRAGDDAHVVDEYMVSRDVMRRLIDENDLRSIVSRPEAGYFSGYRPWFSDTHEKLFQFFTWMVRIDVDDSTGITTLVTKAYRPEDARAVAAGLISKAEEFINALNSRSNQDAVAFSQKIVQEASAKLKDVEQRIAVFRNREGILDPQKEASETLSTLTGLTTEISQLKAALATQQAMAAKGPSIEPLRQRILAMQSEYDQRRAAIVGAPDSIATKLQAYEMLTLERDLASRAVMAAVSELEKARQELAMRRVYLQTVVDPNLPDQPTLPYRMLSILITVVAAYAIYRIVKTLIDATLDHWA